jgi:hypothetical protein
MDNNQISVVPIFVALFATVAIVLLLGMITFLVFLVSRATKRRAYDTGRGQQMQQAAGQFGLGFSTAGRTLSNSVLFEF